MVSIKILEMLETGTFLCRINRFMVEVELRGSKVLAHLPNSGRLHNVLVFTQMLIFQPPDAVELRPNVPALQL